MTGTSRLDSDSLGPIPETMRSCGDRIYRKTISSSVFFTQDYMIPTAPAETTTSWRALTLKGGSPAEPLTSTPVARFESSKRMRWATLEM